MFFEQIKLGMMDNFSYIIADEKIKEAAVVDPGWDYKRLISLCQENNFKITKILLTHGHFDHAKETKNLSEETDAEIFVHKDENIVGEKVHHILDKDIINLGEIRIKVIHTPGHTPGGVCFLVNNKKLITGDTLFVGAVGRTDLPGSDSENMKQSLKRLSKLDDCIEVYPGHDYGLKPTSTIKYEKENNPYMN